MSIPIVPSAAFQVPISSIAAPAALDPSAVGAPSKSAFQDELAGAIQRVEQMQTDASTQIQNFLSGEGGELHSVILATQRADLSFEMFQQMRNKVVSAYQEIMKLQM
jgi:flagellar hook-basal body complex protein FliE